MRIIGVIAEYNPFHKGHAYHLQQIRKLYEADRILVIMSGDFVQRGEPALVDKYIRTRMALMSGADLVLELPVPFATGSSEYFAAGAVSMLDSLGVVNALCFGSECGKVAPLVKLAQILRAHDSAGEANSLNEPSNAFVFSGSQEYSTLLRERLRSGIPYPAARMEALTSCTHDDTIAQLLRSPNNILGIEYCKALLALNSSIQPLTIPREDSAYHQQELSQRFSSATAIRRSILSGDLFSYQEHIPDVCVDILRETLLKNGFSRPDDYFLLLKYRLMNESADSLCEYLDMSPDLARRILSHLEASTSFDGFIKCVKTKGLTYTRICRTLLHVLLNIRSFPMDWTLRHLPAYARILGFRRDAGELLSAVKASSAIPLISKLADRSTILSGTALNMLDHDIWCANLYETVQAHQKKRPVTHECSQTIVRL